MRILIDFIASPLSISEGEVVCLVIETSKWFTKLISYFVENETSVAELIISKDLKVLDNAKIIELLISPFHISVNEKRIVNKLLLELNEIVNSSFYDSFTELKTELINFYDNISNEIHYPIKYNFDIDAMQVIKIADFKIDLEEILILDKIINYMELTTNYLGQKLFVFVNLTTYLEVEELVELIKISGYKKYSILLLEREQNIELKTKCKHYIVDCDLCLI